MASISYNNVLGEQGGNIFSNIKFWIHRGVPLRSDWVKHVKENGGQVVELEKKADYLIADHLKARNAPDGAYSWKFIQDSVRNGALQIADRYLIGPNPDDVRRIAAAKAPKSTRTAYTNEDDGLLARHVLNNWGVRHGNQIYKELYTECPRHPWQSWRDRYVKRFSHLPMEELEKLARHAPVQGTAGSPAVQPAESSVLAASVASKQNIPSSSERQATSHAGSSRQDVVQMTSPPQAQSPEVTRQANLDRSPRVTRNMEGVRETNSANDAETNAESQAMLDIEAGAQDNEGEDDQDNEEENDQDAEEDDIKNQFYGDLENFARQKGTSIQFVLRISGHGSIELWELIQPVYAQGAGPNAIDWAKVATDLAIEPNERNKNKLCAYFEKNVADFVAHQYILEQSRDDSPDEVAAHEVSQDAGSAIKGSVELPRRSREQAADYETMESQPDKRQKVDHVPSTPGARLQPTTSQASEQQQFTGTARRLFVSKDLPEIKDSQEDTQAVLQSPAVRSRSVEATLPVDQSRTPTYHAIQREDTIVDTSPSQQLQEELDSSPRVSRRPNDADTGRRDRSMSVEMLESAAHAHTAAKTTLPPGSSHQQPAPSKRKLPSSFNINVRPPPSQPVPAASRSRPDTNRDSHVTPSLSTIEEYMIHYESLGYPRSIVKRALQATTMTPGGPAAFAMEHLNQRYKDLPSDIAGVWTDRDDRALRFVMLLSHDGQSLDREGKDRRERLLLERARMKRARLLEKHGRQRMKLREKWLNVKGPR